jgi:integrase
LAACDETPLLPKAVVATAAYAGLREGELRGLEWTDYQGNVLSVNRSIWKTFTNKPKTRASANPVPVIRHLAEILSAYRSSVGDPAVGVMFHSGGGEPMDLDKVSCPEDSSCALEGEPRIASPANNIAAANISKRLKLDERNISFVE